MNFFAKNIKYLRKLKGASQTEVASSMGFKQTSWSGYENGTSTPNFNDLLKIIKYFDISASELLEIDLSTVHLNENDEKQKKKGNVHPIVHPTVHPNSLLGLESNKIEITVAAEPEGEYGKNAVVIPITDISVAAGAGAFNQEYITNVESLRLPIQFLKRNSTYLCVKIKGASMAPTLQDGGYVIIRLLDRSEWARMPDERVFVVSDIEGKSYLKRVKNRFKQNFIVLKSDSPDQATFPSFNLATEEINTIWYCEWYFSAKMPNVHDQFYSRLQRLEDKVDDLLAGRPK